MISKKLLIPVVVLTIISGAVLGASRIQAQFSGEPFSGLAEAISQKFNLDKSEVNSVIEEYRKKQHEEMRQNMAQKLDEKLTQDVADGKITEAQKKAILDKFSQLKADVDPQSMKDLTAEERKALREKKQAELKSWAESQGIDEAYIMQGFGRGGMHYKGWARP